MKIVNRILLLFLLITLGVSTYQHGSILANGEFRKFIDDDDKGRYYCDKPVHVGRTGTENGVDYICVDTPSIGWQVVTGESVDIQFANRGLECRINYTDCQPPYKSLAKGDAITFAGEKDYKIEFLKAMERAYGGFFPNLCYDPKHFNPVLIPYIRVNDTAGLIEVQANINGDSDVIARMCPTREHQQNEVTLNGNRLDLFPSVSIQGNAGQPGNWVSWGCCPEGYVGATGSGANAGATQSTFSCCLAEGYDLRNGRINLKNGGELGIGLYYNVNYCVYFSNGSEIIIGTSNDLKNGRPVMYRETIKGIHGLDLGFISTQENGEPLPTQGVVVQNRQGSSRACSNTNGCARLSDDRIVKSSELLERNELECKACYDEGETIGINKKTGAVLTCDPNSQTVLKTTDSVANDVTLTASCLNSGPAGSAGFNGCKSCIEQGGIWIALGCFDPTPIGVITGIIRIIFGVSGGIALLILIQAGLFYMTGKESDIEKAKKQLVALFTGLVVLIFSVVILRIIGINVLDVLPVGSV